ncbi:MAG: cupredoxin domain-containing protein [bacterium]|nr:cupredoxin domain-containing protein [bacterium]MDZ4248193.1 cupredoxin domain-containing protein [Patescibacteria group bacterium]
MNPRIIAAVLILIAVGIGVALFATQRQDEEVIPTSAATPTPAETAATEQSGTTVTLTESGFSPDTVTVDAGDSVVFRNASSSPMLIASNPHPQHTDLSALNSDTVKDGASYTFTFEQAGSWGFHNHLNPSQAGEVTVK